MTADAVGGVWTHALDLSRALGTRQVRVTLAVMGAPLTADQRRDAAPDPFFTLVDRPFRLEWMENAWGDVEEAGRWLLDLAAAVSPDIVHVNGYAHAALPFPAPIVVGAHSCVLSWFHEVKGCAAPASWDRYRSAAQLGLSRAHAIVAPTRAMAEALARHHAPAVRTVRVVPNGRDASLYRAADKEPFVLTAGRMWDEGKNVALVAAAAPRLAWPVYVAGEGADGLPGVRTLGRLPARDLAGWYARASIYVLPARYEPFGLSALEAALSGCALVLGDIASLRELWDGAALFVAPDDEDGLVGAIDRLTRDAALRRRLAARAARRARRFDVARMAEAYCALYQQLADARTGAGSEAACGS
jgi:glycogen synthase